MLDELPDDLLRSVIIQTGEHDDVVKIFQLNRRMRVLSKEKKLAVMWSEEQHGMVEAFLDAVEWVGDEMIARSMIPRMTSTEKVFAYVRLVDRNAWRELLPGPQHVNDLIPSCVYPGGDVFDSHLLCFARSKEDAEVMLALPGIETNVYDTRGITPLISTVERGVVDVASALIEAPVDVNKATPDGTTALHVAAKKGHAQLTSMLLRAAGVNVNPVNNLNATPLHAATMHRRYRIVEMLVNTAGIAINAADTAGFTPLHIAAVLGYTEIIATILSHHGVNLDTRIGDHEYAPMHFATERGHVRAVELLIAAGADVNIQNAGGVTPLIVAASRRNEGMLDAIISAPGVDVNMRMGDGRAPLHFAVIHKHIAAIEMLIEAGADVNMRMGDGRAPLHIAVMKKRVRAVELLLEAGADVNMHMGDGRAPLHIAVEEKQMRAVNLLLAAPGADVNIQTADGTMATPLHFAARGGNEEIVLAILGTRGVDKNMRMADGRDPIRVALDYRHNAAASMIHNAMDID